MLTSYETRLALVFKALSDPNRLRIFDLLTFNDLSNSELMGEIGLSQNLLSHHLNVLAEADLVAVHQSIGDARRRYYSANLEAVVEVQSWFGQHAPLSLHPLPALEPRCRVLFLCQRNAARSLMAEAIARHIASGALDAYSAGVEPGQSPQPLAYQVLAEHGISPRDLRQQSLDELEVLAFDTVITVCDRVHESIDRDRLRATDYLHWSLVDPAELASDPAGQLEETRRLYARLEQRIAVFVQRLAARA
ncbi:MAG: metalloregulator ArsR/SmtB family transcription factor [Chloroflexota bacterium]